jgi:hypothetical protein
MLGAAMIMTLLDPVPPMSSNCGQANERRIGRLLPSILRAVLLSMQLGAMCRAQTPSPASPGLPLTNGMAVTLRATRDLAAIQLSWTPLHDDVAYTVEFRDSWSEQNVWAPALASVWPLDAVTWRDPVPALGATRFYRISPSPASAVRGRLLAATSLGVLSPAQIQAIYAQIGVPIPAEGGVQLYKLTYETVNPFGVRTIATGLLVYPQGSNHALPLVSYQHGTLVSRTEVPSAFQGLERVIGIAFGSSGYVAVLPDYLGLGDSPGLHPFIHAKTEATAGVDMLRAARVFCASNSVTLNGQLFLIGYSQGGHATMALHRELETFHTNEFTITASAPMAGPYDVSGVMTRYFLSGSAMPNPYYFLFLVAAYQSIYHIATSFSDVLASPYDRTLPPLLDGQHDGAELNLAMGTSIPTQVFRPEFLEALRNDPNHPMRLALQENDLYDWTPRAPMRLYHCDGDQDVLFANSLVAYNSFVQHGATQVQLIDPYPTATHGDCAPIALLAAKFLWFDTLVQK